MIADELEQVAAAFAGYVRRERVTDPDALRALAELERIAVSFRVVSIDDGEAVWLDTAEAAQARGVSVRTVERWAAAGTIEAKREGWQWSIRQNSSTARAG